jgi:hypothetical protein
MPTPNDKVSGDAAHEPREILMARGSQRRNADYPWDQFDPVAYFKHNYETMRNDDSQVLAFVRDYFVRVAPGLADRHDAHGIDIGAGPNLYPALAMLPFCEDVELYEYSRSNVAWLEQQKAARWPTWATSWRDFWTLLCKDPSYAGADRPDMPAELSRRIKITHGNVFDLNGTQHERYDIGTMFFGPESLSPQKEEFASALDHLLDVLRPNAPFAVAFMEHSKGYPVAENEFPATDIGLDDVLGCLRGRTWDLCYERIGTTEAPLRAGYTGMIIACGRVAADSAPKGCG